MTKDRDIYLKFVFLIILGFLMIIVFKTYYQIFDFKMIIIISISYLVFLIGIIINQKIAFVGYLISLLTILFYREKINDNYTDSEYINLWIKNLFSNKIIFINVFGNIILYIPFIHYLNLFSKNIIFSIIMVFNFILIGEYVQYLLKIGVFDLVDIVINTLGVLIYVLIYGVLIWMKKIKKNNLIKMN